MKICILSMQKINNTGSLLQAYALKKFLESTGATVDFIDIKRIGEDYALLKDYLSQRTVTTARVSVLKKFNRYFFTRAKNKLFQKRQKRLFEQFREEKLAISRKGSRYDLCVIGSDEVFNCINAGYWGFSSQLFGNVDVADRIITYAASCGSTDFSNLPIAVVERIKGSFKRISGFSVRDENTFLFASKMTEKEINYNLDPVMVYDFSEELRETSLPRLPRRYCVIYSYSNRIENTKEIDVILNLCKKNDVVPVALGEGQFWCRRFLPCTPFECLKVISNAEFLITDTFHGTVFSAKFCNRFAIIVRNSNKNKLLDLVKRLGISDHLAYNPDELEKALSLKKETDRIQKLILAEKEKTLDYLVNHIFHE